VTYNAPVLGFWSIFLILVVLALLLAVLSIPFGKYPLLATAVILLAVALIAGGRIN